MNLQYARYIMEVARQKNITSAAHTLYISQPSLSQIINKIEKELGTILFQRTSDGLLLTEAGKLYLEAMESAILIDQNLRRQILELTRSAITTLRIGVSTMRTLGVLPDLLCQITEKYPSVRFSIKAHPSKVLEEMVQEGALDIALVMANSNNPLNKDLTYTLLERQEVVLLAGQNTQIAGFIPSKSCIDISDAKNERFISLTPGHNCRDIQDRLFVSYDISPQILLETNEMNIALKLINELNAVGIVLLSYLPITQNHQQPIIYYHLNHVATERHFYAIYRKDLRITDFISDFLTLSHSLFGSEKDLSDGII